MNRGVFIKNTIKLTANILFSGIGAQEKGFENSGLFDIDVLTTSDISKESVLSYAAIHCGLTNEMVGDYKNYPSKEEMAKQLADIKLGYDFEKDKPFDWVKLSKKKKGNLLEKYWLANKLSKNVGDISKIKDLPYADFWTCSFPCTDVSIAGKMKGLNPDSSTRSSLLWENIRLLHKAQENNKLPKYVMFENVKNLVSKKFIDDFNKLLDIMSELGFNSYWKVLNGKECGIPQNRERVFVIAIRKDIDMKQYEFPIPFDNGLRLKDVLEDTVDEKYYLSEEVQNRFQFTDNTFTKAIIGTTKPDFRTIGQRDLVYQQDMYMGALTATDYKQPKQILTGIDKSINDTKQIDFANCITAREDRGVSKRKSEGTAVCELNQIGYLNDSNAQANRIYDDSIARTIVGEAGGGGAKTGWYLTEENLKSKLRIRKLIPLECYRLMGFSDKDFYAAESIGVADTHLYKQAGNSIITNCVKLLAEHLYKAQYDDTYICEDEHYTENFTQPQVIKIA